MAISGKVGNVYSSALSVEDCEDAWTAGIHCATSIVAGKVGTSCARATSTTAGAGEILQYEDFTAVSLTAYDGIYFWVRSEDMVTAAGDLQLRLGETSGCVGAEETLNIPALATNTWKQCFARLADPSILNLVISVGLYQVTNLGDGDFDIDDVEALREIDGIKSWTLDYTADTLDATDFDDAGTKAYIIGGSGWSGSFEGFKDTTPLGMGAEVYLVLGESTTAYQNWIGKAIITACHPSTSYDGIVTYSYDFQGTGELTSPSA